MAAADTAAAAAAAVPMAAAVIVTAAHSAVAAAAATRSRFASRWLHQLTPWSHLMLWGRPLLASWRPELSPGRPARLLPSLARLWGSRSPPFRASASVRPPCMAAVAAEAEAEAGAGLEAVSLLSLCDRAPFPLAHPSPRLRLASEHCRRVAVSAHLLIGARARL